MIDKYSFSSQPSKMVNIEMIYHKVRHQLRLTSINPRLTRRIRTCLTCPKLISAVVVFLFEGGQWFTGAIIIGPNFHPKFALGGLNYSLQTSHVAFHVDWPSRTLLAAKPAWQDAVLLRRMTTTALFRLLIL